MPLKVWKDCLRCSKFEQCDEIAVLKRLRADGPVNLPDMPELGLIQLPTPAR